MTDRGQWLREKQRESEHRYDTVFAPTYDADDAPMSAAHRRFVGEIVQRCPDGGHLLDVPCGTGKYFGLMLTGGRRVTGCDQSAGMLERARAKYPAQTCPNVTLCKTSLQDLAYDAEFDAAICVDAMEDIAPEVWPAVLANLRRAVRPGGHLYLTVEMTDESWLVEAFAKAKAAGLPVVPNEDTTRGDGYHYYPPLGQVREWLDEAGLQVVEQAHSDGGHPSYSYEHFLSRRP
jgi:ubiquinone/menaquinone biosynthesis C-methylase UbiE